MPVPTLYLDSSTVGAFHERNDAWQREPTRELWRCMEMGYVRFAASEVGFAEIVEDPGTPEAVRELFRETFPMYSLLPLDEEAMRLAGHYIGAGILTRNHVMDALHVAVCSVARIGWLISWNYRHLTQPARRDAFNVINLLHGYEPVRIVNPKVFLDENT